MVLLYKLTRALTILIIFALTIPSVLAFQNLEVAQKKEKIVSSTINTPINQKSKIKPLAIAKSNPTLVDSDGDGIPNLEDMDDDNDGIPDAVECQALFQHSRRIGSSNNSSPQLYKLLGVEIPLTVSTTGAFNNGSFNDLNINESFVGQGQYTIAIGDSINEIRLHLRNIGTRNTGVLNTSILGINFSEQALIGNFSARLVDGTILTNLAPHIDDNFIPPFFPNAGEELPGVTTINGVQYITDLTDNVTQASGVVTFPALTGYQVEEITFDHIGDGIGPSLHIGITASVCPDTDHDGIMDFLDLDSDNDAIPDVVEAGGQDANGDGMLDAVVDVDSDGLMDIVDNNLSDGPTGAAPCSNYPSCGVATSTSNLPMNDSDGDGLMDWLDGDADNDGITDLYEGQSTIGFIAPTDMDADRDGVDDAYDTFLGFGGSFTSLSNIDGGAPDYIDTDTDSDGVVDWIEGLDDNGDGDPLAELQVLLTTYLSNGGAATDYPVLDSDGDGLLDWMDEAPHASGYNLVALPPFLTPTSSFWIDRDQDGIADLVDAVHNESNNPLGTAASRPDNNGIGDRDWRDINPNANLPIELLTFNAVRINKDEVQLNWSTATELNNKGFYIERMLDLEQVFEAVAWVTGQGSSTTIHHYDNVNLDSYRGISYYRLKQVDYDGTVSYSKTVAVSGEKVVEEGSIPVVLFPNPVGSYLKIRFNNITETEAVTIHVQDVQGRTVKAVEKTVEPYQVLALNELDLLSSGTYVIVIKQSNKGKYMVQKFVKMP